MSDDFTPNPMYAYGRIDTSAGEGGESLRRVNPVLFGAAPEDIVLVPSPVGNVPEPPEGTTAEPSFAPGDGTVDTSQPGVSPSAADAGDGEGEGDGDGGNQDPPADLVDYNEMLKADLVALADERGIDSSGTKADIIERLQQADVA